MPECQGCGAHITERFARVFGNNDGEVYSCIECGQMHGVYGGDRAGLK